jgi:hypothetical protein
MMNKELKTFLYGSEGKVNGLRAILTTAVELGLVGVSIATYELLYFLTTNSLDPAPMSSPACIMGTGTTVSVTTPGMTKFVDRIIHRRSV